MAFSVATVGPFGAMIEVEGVINDNWYTAMSALILAECYRRNPSDEQMERLGVCACRTVSFADVPKAIIMRRTEGLIKMAIHPQSGEIMGVHILAPHASELIAEAMMLVRNKNTIDDVLESLPMFPTLSESIKMVAMAFTRDISKLSCCV